MSAPIRRFLSRWVYTAPQLLWIPDDDSELLRSDGQTDLFGSAVNCSVVPGGVAPVIGNPLHYVRFPTNFGAGANHNFLGIALVSVHDPTTLIGTIFKLGDENAGLGFGAGLTTLEDSGSKLITLREGVEWHVGPANAFVAGCNVVSFGRTSDGVISYTNHTTNIGLDVPQTYTAPSNQVGIQGYYTNRSSNIQVHALAVYSESLSNIAFVYKREELARPLTGLFRKSRKEINEMFQRPPRRWFGAGAAGDTYSLTATGLAGGTPALDAPALTQNHGVTASNIAGAAPTLGSPALSQNHALTATNLTGAEPTLGTPAVTFAGTLVANDITGAAPVLASAVLTQNHALTATAIGGAQATLGPPALTQNHVVTAANLTGAAPVLGTPTVVLGGTLVADNILGATPTLGSPALTQNHALTASPLLGAAPILGSPAFGQNHLLTGSNIVGTAPQLGQPDLTSGSSGGAGATVEEIVDAMMAALNATTIPVDVQRVNAVTIYGSGTDLDPWRESP